ncbi:MAG: GNAT family N-acetyltransferase [Pseudomonadota bacterium]
MPVHRFTDPEPFLARTRGWLLERPAENAQLLGVAGQALATPSYYRRALFWLVEEDGRPLLVAVTNPPRPLMMCQSAEEGLDDLLDSVREAWGELPGVFGPRPLATGFARRWGGAWREAMALRLYELREVLPDPRRPEGTLRRALEADLPSLIHWIEAFDHEAHLTAIPPAEETAARLLEGGRAWFFERGGQRVALVAGAVDHGILARIGMVYTPPALRGQGFASAATAAFSEALLQQGATTCLLFTDLANPTSNAIYQRIGYRPVSDWVELARG